MLAITLITDPLYAVSTIASVVLCAWMGLIGSVAVVQRRSMITEVVSHVMFPLIIMLRWIAIYSTFAAWIIFLIGTICTISALFYLEDKIQHKDASSSFMLGAGFGIGLFMASILQTREPQLYREILIGLNGNLSTIMWHDLYRYLIYYLLSILFFAIFWRGIIQLSFDRSFFMQTDQKKAITLEWSILFQIIFVIYSSIHAVGVVLLAGFMIFPVSIVRIWYQKFSSIVIGSTILAAVVAYTSMFIAAAADTWWGILLPNSATIVLLFSIIYLASLVMMINKNRINIYYFQAENIQKILHKEGPYVLLNLLPKKIDAGWMSILISLIILIVNKSIKVRKKSGLYELFLTKKGSEEAKKLIRAHRLWEYYLVKELQVDKEAVHAEAEEAEHFISDKKLQQLDGYLDYPKKDPHDTDIPR